MATSLLKWFMGACDIGLYAIQEAALLGLSELHQSLISLLSFECEKAIKHFVSSKKITLTQLVQRARRRCKCCGQLWFKMLLRAKASTFVSNKLRATHLHAASLKCHVQVVETLLEAGADPYAANQGRVTPLYNIYIHT